MRGAISDQITMSRSLGVAVRTDSLQNCDCLLGMKKLDDGLVDLGHAGTQVENGKLLSNGGRVLNVTALGKSVAEAKERAEAAIGGIDWPEGFHRHDIGWRAISRERNLRLDR